MRMSLPQEGTHSSLRGLTYSGAVAPARGGHGSPYCWDPSENVVGNCRKIVNVVGNCRNIVNVVGNCQSCRREGGGGGVWLKIKNVVRKNFWFVGKKFRFVGKVLPLPPPQKKTHKKTWVPRRHCLLNNTVILRSRACTFTVGWSHCHIQNSL